MRICHVITKPELGGAQLTTLNLLSNLPKDKYNISIITSPSGILKPDFKSIEGARVYFSRFLTRPINPIVDILGLMDIYLIYRCQKYDLVHTHSSKAGIIGRWAARFAEIKIIVHTVHGWSFNSYQNIIKKWFFILLERVTARFTTRIICVSKKDIETGLRYKIAHEDKFVLIKYGIPLVDFKKKADRQYKKMEMGVNNDDPIVGMISCLKPQKSPEDYVKAAIEIHNRRPNVNFILVGDGILKIGCKKILKKSDMDGRFIFAGWRRDVSEILDIIDVVVLTSKWEGMSVVAIEALAKGRPVVITDVGGARELVNNGVSGYITRPGSYKETAEKILEILGDKSRLDKMGEEAALSIDKSFDIKNMAQNIDKLYQDTLVEAG